MYIPNRPLHLAGDPLLRDWRLWLCNAFGLLVFVVSPDDVLSRFPTVAQLVHFVEGVVPSIEKWGELSAFPQRTRLFLSVMWVLLPALVAFQLRNPALSEHYLAKWKKADRYGLRGLLLLVFTTSGLFAAALLAVRDFHPCLLCVNTSTVAFWFIGTLIVNVVSYFVALVVWWIMNIRRIYF